VFDKSNELDDLINYCTRLAHGPGDTVSGGLDELPPGSDPL
jgi:hypothetical protein